MQVIGLTGGIASGKSAVSYYLITHGYEVIDADDISRHALEPGTEAFKQVIEHFPVLDNGIINRQKLADIIFNNQDEKNYLEGILHPYIRSVIVQKIKQSKNNIVFIDVPLLFEAGWDDLCDSTIVVSCDKETQIQRVLSRDHCTRTQALDRIRNQMSLEDKEQRADYIIRNNTNYYDLEKEILKVLKEVE